MLGWLIMALFATMFLGIGLTVTGYVHLARRGIPAILIGLLCFAMMYALIIGETVMVVAYFFAAVVCTMVYAFYEPAPVTGGEREW